MKSLFYVLSSLAVIGLAFWAYRENYETQKAATETQSLQRSIGEARARLAVLRAEWAYLNRPDRLRELAELNFVPLGLLPLGPEQFGKANQVDYPASQSLPELELNNPVDVSTLAAEEAAE